MRPSAYTSLKPKILELRQQGLSYSQIQEKLGVKIPQSTLSNWCGGIPLSLEQQAALKKRMSGTAYSRAVASSRAATLRSDLRQQVIQRNSALGALLDNIDVGKLALLMLYLGEGAKNEQGTVSFSNSNPGIIRLYLKLFLQSYETELSKFRITVQCRADQDIDELERFWKSVINIPEIRFYNARIDKRTVGFPTRKKEYRGVCRIDYIDAKIQLELVNVGAWLCV